jgi:outer membrane protein assembly factor BamB
MKINFTFFGLLLICLGLNFGTLQSGPMDWPMWRYDFGRRAFAEIILPDNPVLLWTRQLEEPKRCWPFQYEDYFTGGNPDRIGKLSFDISYEPIIGEGKLFVPSMVSDRLTAYSTGTGEELWRYYAGGPVRFAPVYNAGKVYFVSDDGFLYCLNATTGELLWKYHGSYSDRMVLGNGRIISMWPARGGPVIKDGIIYFASGVIPFEGTFVHAVDATSGRTKWTNSTTGSTWALHQHGGAFSYGGASPQGYLAISGDKLIVPGGRTPPTVFDIHSGEFLYYNQASGVVGKGAGGFRAFASGDWFFNHGMLYATEDGAQFGHVPGDVITDNSFIGVTDGHLIAHNADVKKTEVEVADRLERGTLRKQYELEELWKTEVADMERLYFSTKSHFAISGNGGKTASLLNVTPEGKPGNIAWKYNIDGEIWSIFAGDGKLYVVNKEGKIYCFGAQASDHAKHHTYKTEVYNPNKRYSALANSIMQRTKADAGYGMIYGGANSDLIKGLVDNSDMHFIVVEPDATKIEMLRRRFDDADIYGSRVVVIKDDHNYSPFLPYIYDLIVVQGSDHTPNQIDKIFNSLRPYGGTACFIGAGARLVETIKKRSLENGEPGVGNGFAFLTRKGALPGSAQWTHQYGSASNRTYSDDNLVKAPLGTLWFGGPSNLNTLPRHHNGPIPQVAGGRLILLGVETISARCVYTGRELWVKELPGIGHLFTDMELEARFLAGNEVYMSNNPGANFIGSPYVSLEDVIYIIYKDNLLSLDAATGAIKTEFRLPESPDIKINEFGHILVSGDYLIAAIDPQMFDDGIPGKTNNWNGTSSSLLLVMDRHSGKVMWTIKAEKGFRHNAIVAGTNRVFLVDGLSEGVVEILQRRGLENKANSELMALDIKTGKKLWSNKEGIFGTWLGLYEDKEILLQGGRHGQRGRPEDEPGERLVAHSSLTGKIIWESNQRYSGPLGLHPDMIIPGGAGQSAYNPNTGETVLRNHPVTGEKHRWDWHKYYGCGTMNTSKHLISFRSGSAGYNDLSNFGGTGNISGFKAGCTNNLVAAEGVLNGPDYSRTCTCSYPLQSSFGLVHMPDVGVEMWTLNRLTIGNEPIRALGINFGGQGNRRESGVLWLEYPKIYGAGPDIPIKIESNSNEWFRNHATWIENPTKYDWVASYGAKGITSISVDLVPEGSIEQSYNVTLYFVEPDDISAGKRIFDVSIQGKKVLENFDIVQQVGGSRRVIIKEFKDIKIKETLDIKFSNNTNSTVISGVEIIMSDFITSSLD